MQSYRLETMEMNGSAKKSTDRNERMLMFNNPGHRVDKKLVRVDRKQQHSQLMCTFLVLFVALFLVMTTMFVIEKRKQFQSASEQGTVTIIHDNPTKSPSKPQVCKTVDCILTIKDLMNCIDPRRNPCEDFYEYACGGWMKTHKIPKGRDDVDEWVLLDIKVNDFLINFVNNKALQKEFANVSAIMKAVLYYETCVNLPEKDPSNGKELTDLVHKYIPWPIVDSKWNESIINVETLLGAISRDLNVNPFLETKILTDLKNSSHYMINLRQTFDFGIMIHQFTLNTSNGIEGRKAYRKLIRKIVLAAGAQNTSQTERDIDDIFNLERYLAKHLKGYRIANEEKYYGKYTISELAKYTENKFSWLAFFNELFRKTGYRFSPEQNIVVSAISDVKIIIDKLKTLPKRTLLNYVGWRIIQHLDSLYMYASKEFYKMRKEFRKEAYNGAPTFDIKTQCLRDLKDTFAMALARVYVDKHFPRNSKKLAEEIAQSINKVFQQTLIRSDWMDKKTKHAAIEKVKHVWGNYGYPDYILDDKLLDDHYKLITVYKDSILKTIWSVKAAQRLRELDRIKTTNDRTKWTVNPLIVSPNYIAMNNLMSFPATFLQPPLYDPKYLRAVSYGGVGAIIGHELMHGFDNFGKSYDKEGNLRNWWTDKTVELYTNKTKCFVDQYNGYFYAGMPLNGDMSLTENIADNIGVQEAFKAYRRFVEVNGEEPRLPGTLFNNDQVFFLSFARNWCQVIDPQAAIFEALYSDYAPSPYRVNGPLQNLPEFSKVFNCPVGSYMNPKKKCSTW